MHTGRAYFTKIHNHSYCFRYKLHGKKLQIAVTIYSALNSVLLQKWAVKEGD